MELERWEHFFDARPRRLEPRRQHQRLAEMRRIFVNREAGTVGGQLEQHATRLLEVDRLEPEAIDDGRRMVARRLDARSHLVLLLVVIDAPGEMMHAADAPCPAAPFGRLLDVEDARRSVEAIADDTVVFTEAVETKHAGDEALRELRFALPDLRAVQPADLTLVRDGAAVPRR